MLRLSAAFGVKKNNIKFTLKKNFPVELPAKSSPANRKQRSIAVKVMMA
jgi:hypothetical protein